MNPKFALLVDTTEELLQAVVATAPISLFAFDHTDAITLSEGKALSRTSGSNRRSAHQGWLWPHQMVARGAPRFHLAFPLRP